MSHLQTISLTLWMVVNKVKHTTFAFVIIVLFVLSCSGNAKPPYAKYVVLSDDTVDVKIEVLDSFGRTKRIYHEKDSLLHGLDQEFYPSGVKKVEGKWYNGKRVGWFQYYDEGGKLRTLREYIIVNDPENWNRDEAYLNQVIRFDGNGDTLKPGSIFMRLYTVGDTIKDGETYAFKILLAAPMFKEMYIVLCDFDEQYSLQPNAVCDTFGVESYQRAFSPKNYVLGENVKRGKIINFENYLDSSGKWRNKVATIYFTDKFYVKPR